MSFRRKEVRRLNKGKLNSRFTSPLFSVLCLVMIAMAIASFWWNIYIFAAEMIIVAFSIIAVIVSTVRLKRYLKKMSSEALISLEEGDPEIIARLNTAAVIVGENNEIVAVNPVFQRIIGESESAVGMSIEEYLINRNMVTLYEDNGTETLLGEKWYLAFGVRTGKSSVVYFVDNNEYKTNSDEYLQTRPVVMIIAFDNREELERDAEEGEASRVGVLIERVIAKWIGTTTGFYKKLTGGRYLVVTEERFVRRFIDEKFKVLEEVREIQINDRMNATISIGVGRGGATAKECEQWARQALDMALGRGGDQAAVKKGETYQFFGGVSKGIEKRDKVRTRVIATTLANHISNSSNVLIMGHRFSDLDSVGACIGMWSAVVKGLHRNAYIVIDRQQTLARPLVSYFEKAGFESIFKTEEEAFGIVDDHSLLIVCDTHSPNFVESKALYERCERVVVIDHHRMMVNHIDNALVFYHEPYASSACEMTAELIQYLGDCQLSRIESEALLSGIMLDTKNFVLRTGVRTFEAAAFLRSSGADTVEVKRLFSNSIDTYKVKYKLVSDAEIYNYCAVACADDGIPDIRIASAQAADELLGIENVKASFVLYRTGKTVNISARSLGDLNVQIIMESLGGGGHLTMAACQLEGVTMAEAKEKLLAIINELEINKKPEEKSA